MKPEKFASQSCKLRVVSSEKDSAKEAGQALHSTTSSSKAKMTRSRRVQTQKNLPLSKKSRYSRFPRINWLPSAEAAQTREKIHLAKGSLMGWRSPTTILGAFKYEMLAQPFTVRQATVACNFAWYNLQWPAQEIAEKLWGASYLQGCRFCLLYGGSSLPPEIVGKNSSVFHLCPCMMAE